MSELIWLLIPVAAASGWYAARVAGTVGFRRSASSIPDEYIKGLNFLLNEQPDKALEVFIRIVEVDSDTVETHIVLGNLFRRRGEVDRAIRVHQNLIARPNLSAAHKADALLELGRDYLRAGLLDRAESYFKEVVQIGGQTAQAYRHLREIYEQEKDWLSAIATAERLNDDGGVPQAEVIAHYYCELGEAAIADGDPRLASHYAKKALAHDPRSVRASVLLGDLAFEQADYKGAIKRYVEVYTGRPEYVSLVLPRLREAHVRRNDLEGYVKLLRDVRKGHYSVSAVLGLVDGLKECDQEAVQAILAAELDRPMVPLKMISEFIHAQLQERAHDADRALKCVAKALEAHLERRASHLCSRCGLETKGHYWQCPGCHRWGTIKPVDQLSQPQASAWSSAAATKSQAPDTRGA
jgi:lipopolysaccharide biosynthesis regulator YciM